MRHPVPAGADLKKPESARIIRLEYELNKPAFIRIKLAHDKCWLAMPENRLAEDKNKPAIPRYRPADAVNKLVLPINKRVFVMNKRVSHRNKSVEFL